MKKIIILVSMAFLASCDTDDRESRTRIPDDPEELAVWNAVYDDGYKYPEGFYTEPRESTTSIQYLGREAAVDGKSVYLQYSTDNRNEAREIVVEALADHSRPPTLTGESETERYFEFVSISETEYVTHTVLWRIHKASYYRPVDMMLSSFLSGVLAPQSYEPYTMGIYGGELSTEAVRELIESLWYFKTHRMGGDKVLATEFGKNGDRFVYTIKSTSVTYGDWGLYDEISVVESTFELDTGTRELRSTGCTLLKAIQGRYNSL